MDDPHEEYSLRVCVIVANLLRKMLQQSSAKKRWPPKSDALPFFGVSSLNGRECDTQAALVVPASIPLAVRDLLEGSRANLAFQSVCHKVSSLQIQQEIA